MMIVELFDAQILRLAAAVARRRGSDPEAEAASLRSLSATVAGSVVGIFEVAGMRPEAAEIVAKAYSLGWADGCFRWTGETLSDAVLERTQALAKPTAPPRRIGALPIPVDPPGRVPGVVNLTEADDAA